MKSTSPLLEIESGKGQEKKASDRHKKETLKDFTKNCRLKVLGGHKRHIFLHIILPRNFSENDGEEDTATKEIFSHNAFSERLELEFANQTKEKWHGSSATVAIEECAVKCFLPGSPERISHLFCHLSDEKQQDPAVAMDHTSTLVSDLKDENALKK